MGEKVGGVIMSNLKYFFFSDLKYFLDWLYKGSVRSLVSVLLLC